MEAGKATLDMVKGSVIGVEGFAKWKVGDDVEGALDEELDD